MKKVKEETVKLSPAQAKVIQRMRSGEALRSNCNVIDMSYTYSLNRGKSLNYKTVDMLMSLGLIEIDKLRPLETDYKLTTLGKQITL